MKRTITVLGVLLTLQLLLAAGLYTGRDRYGTFVPEEKLLSFDSAAVDGIRITDGEGKSLEIIKSESGWKLPSLGDFPAAVAEATGMIEKAAAFEKGWPVATTSGAAERFKVADSDFERRLELLRGDATAAALLVGTSPGLRKVHVRVPGEDTVYAVELGVHELAVDANSWIDRDLLKLDRSEIAGIEIPGVKLERRGEAFALAGLGDGEEQIPEEVEGLITAVANFRIRSVLKEGKASAQAIDSPDLVFSVSLKDGTVREYRFAKPGEAAEYWLRTTGRDEVFTVDTRAVDRIRETVREKLVRAKTPAPEGAATGTP